MCAKIAAANTSNLFVKKNQCSLSDYAMFTTPKGVESNLKRFTYRQLLKSLFTSTE